MYDQCSHCFKMYHVNINTSYQICWLWAICPAGNRVAFELCRHGSSCPQDWEGVSFGEGCVDAILFLWGPSRLWLCHSPKGRLQLLRLGWLKWKECCMSPPGEHPLFLSLASPCVLLRGNSCTSSKLFSTNSCWTSASGVGDAIWSLEDSFSLKTIIETARSPQSGSISVTFGSHSLPNGPFGCSKVTVTIPWGNKVWGFFKGHRGNFQLLPWRTE